MRKDIEVGEDLKTRASKLVPWATSGWAGYRRIVRENLSAARDAAKRHDVTAAQYFMLAAEASAHAHAPSSIDDYPKERLHTGELVEATMTYRQMWDAIVASRNPYIFDVSGF